jgi:hypothetical protein
VNGRQDADAPERRHPANLQNPGLPIDQQQHIPAKGWYSRNYLPHCDVLGLIQAIAFRLADALPKSIMSRLNREAKNDADKQRHIEAFLDSGHGCCWLREPQLARIVETALLHFASKRYRLLA